MSADCSTPEVHYFDMAYEDQIQTGSLIGAISPGGQTGGIGLAPPPVPMSVQTPRQTTEDDLTRLSPMKKVGLMLQAFGSRSSGVADPVTSMIEENRKARLLQLQEHTEYMKALDFSVSRAQKISEEDRPRFDERQVRMLDQLQPGLGETYKSMAKQPNTAKLLAEYADTPIAQTLLAADKTGKSLLSFLEKPGSHEVMQKQRDEKSLPIVTRKLQQLKAQISFAVTPDRLKEIMADGIVDHGEIVEINDSFRNHPAEKYRPLALTDSEMRTYDRNSDTVSRLVGIRSPKASEALQAAKDKAAIDKNSTLAKLIAERDALPNGSPERETYEKMITHTVNPQAQKIIVPQRENQPQWLDIEDPLDHSKSIKVNPALYNEDKYKTGDKTGVLGGSKVSTTAGTKTAKAEEQNATIDEIMRQIDEMKMHVKNNEGTFSGTVGPKGAVNRLFETGAGVVGADVSTPALELESKKELLIANIRKLVAGGGQFTDKDAKRVESSLGTGMMANPKNTLKSMDDLITFMKSKRGGGKKDNASSRPKAEDFFRP